MKSSYLSRRHSDYSVVRRIGVSGVLSAIMVPLLLSACGGNSAGDNKTTLPTISGTAATGMAIASTDVSVKCRTGTGTGKTGSDGSFKVTVPNGTLPCVLEITNPADNRKLHAISITGDTANLTPLTELLSTRLMRADMSTIFTSFDANSVAKNVTSTSIKTAQNDVTTALKGIVDTSTLADFYSTPLKPATSASPNGGDAQDKLLDGLKARLTSAQFTQTLNLLSKAEATGQPLANPDTSFIPTLEIQPANVRLAAGTAQSFSAAINYPKNVYYLRQPVSWKVIETDGGSIDINGLYTAPVKPGVYHVKVQRDDFPSLSVQATVTVEASSNFNFIPELKVPLKTLTLSAGARYHFSASINYAPNVFYLVEPITWSVVEADGGSFNLPLPADFGLGEIGMYYTAPQKPGVYHVKVQRTDYPDLNALIEVTVQ
ncbi:hypothetical protein [Undibacterium sp. RuTC16W]|uniref:hypothetical protein n=1 Tax=Undibacterium sp. RuTC16W TaxID=3413048 RepID=UPI003BEFEDE4